MKRGMHKVFLCDEIVDLGGGRGYTCGRHTKDRRGKCQFHRPPPAEKGPRQPLRPIMPRQIRLEVGGE